MQKSVGRTAAPAASARRGSKGQTGVTLKRLKELNRALLEFPAGFHLNPKLVKAVERRRTLLDKPESAESIGRQRKNWRSLRSWKMERPYA